jgi:hypothetical protein
VDAISAGQKDALLTPQCCQQLPLVNYMGHVHAVLKYICGIVCMVLVAEVGMSATYWDIIYCISLSTSFMLQVLCHQIV